MKRWLKELLCPFSQEISPIRNVLPILEKLGGVFKDFLYVTPKIGEDEPILTLIFFKGVETTNQKRWTPF